MLIASISLCGGLTFTLGVLAKLGMRDGEQCQKSIRRLLNSFSGVAVATV